MENKSNKPSVEMRIRQDYAERLHSLVKDGYICRHIFNGKTFSVTRLHHSNNGNEIILKANYRWRTLVQETNGKGVFYQRY